MPIDTQEVLRSRYEDRDSIMYPPEGTQGTIFRTFDVNTSLHDSPLYREREYRPSNVLGSSSSGGQRGDSSPYRNPTTHSSRSLAEIAPLSTKKSRGRTAKTQIESSQSQRSWVERPTLPDPGTPESLGPIEISSPQRIHEKSVRFSDKVYLGARSPERFSGAVGHRRDTRRGQSENHLTRAPGNGDITGELRSSGGYNKTLPKRSHAGEKRREQLPPAPVIPRLPTPDFESAPHYDVSLAKYDFCPCCSSDDRDGEEGMRWKKGKAKMDKQVDHARAYISRMTMSERLITDA
ncbi:hypothetical protein F5X98DRAFT_369477 [Xylaria grammica]|nr:hypothetical protein F5X98DRAFT_369477 [Xylaria grammica]